MNSKRRRYLAKIQKRKESILQGMRPMEAIYDEYYDLNQQLNEWAEKDIRNRALNANAFWNGLPTQALRGSAIVAESNFPEFWGKELIGQRIDVVAVDVNGEIDFLDDRDGEGWRKVTEGHGGPRYPHKNLNIIAESFELREDDHA